MQSQFSACLCALSVLQLSCLFVVCVMPDLVKQILVLQISYLLHVYVDILILLCLLLLVC